MPMTDEEKIDFLLEKVGGLTDTLGQTLEVAASLGESIITLAARVDKLERNVYGGVKES